MRPHAGAWGRWACHLLGDLVSYFLYDMGKKRHIQGWFEIMFRIPTLDGSHAGAWELCAPEHGDEGSHAGAWEPWGDAWVRIYLHSSHAPAWEVDWVPQRPDERGGEVAAESS